MKIPSAVPGAATRETADTMCPSPARASTNAGENANTLAALPRVWAHSLGRQRTTACGSYLARNPARVAPLRVGVARKDRFQGGTPRAPPHFHSRGGRAAGHGVSSVDRRIAIHGRCHLLNHRCSEL